MSAVPKKKLCWNCDGNVAKQIDNCPYCGVYLLAPDEEENRWNPNYQASDNDEEAVPTPLYQMQQDETDEAVDELPSETTPFLSSELFQKLKVDIGPVLLLMSGSIFFLFGIILLLFSQNGLLTLQWNGSNWIYFLSLGIPFIFMGWRFLQQVEPENS